ncbi:MAG: hypothetical protein ACRC33_07265 [Gemmataceae bacterium]
MAYRDFTLERVRSDLGIVYRPGDLFPDVNPVAPPAWLTDQLQRGQMMPMTSEKARNERIVAPILFAVGEAAGAGWTLFSGHTLNVDPARGLTGECDFLLAHTEPMPALSAPLLAVVEAKRGEIDVALGQCAAQMVAARIFNERAALPTPVMHGCVTNGRDWQFLRLEGQGLTIDRRFYTTDDLGRLLGVFQTILA